MADQVPKPPGPAQPPKRALEGEQLEKTHTPLPVLPEDSAVTKTEKVERNGAQQDDTRSEEPSAKRVKLEQSEAEAPKVDSRNKVKGIALVKPE
jgi:tRNA-dihydrouridine synthase 3